eukprot:10509944-Karenia_brevis.AAC.1
MGWAPPVDVTGDGWNGLAPLGVWEGAGEWAVVGPGGASAASGARAPCSLACWPLPLALDL